MKQFNYDNLFEKIKLGVRRGAAHALAEHKKTGRSIAVWKDGQVVWIPAEDIKVNEELLKDK